MEKRSSPRALFKDINWKLSLLLPHEAVKQGATPSFIEPVDIGVNGVGFLTDLAFNLDTNADILLYNEDIDNVMLIQGNVIRVDHIQEVDVPEVTYKVFIQFEDIDLEYYQLIRGVTE